MTPHLALFAAGVAVLAVAVLLVVRGVGRVGVCLPGLVVALAAVAHDKPAVALGTIVGGNVAAVGLVLGVAAVVRPIRGGSPVLAAALPLVLVSTLLFWFLVRDNILSRADALVLLLAFAGVVAYLRRGAKGEPWPVVRPSRRGVLLALLGVGLLVGGGVVMIRGAVEIASFVGATQLMFGLTAVAVGASLPALVVAVREPGSALGTVVAVCVVNALVVAGVTALVSPMRASDGILIQELPAMALFAVLLVPCLANGLRVSRWEGALLLAAYLGFVAWQMITAVK
jgi:cation:H+ antiporter